MIPRPSSRRTCIGLDVGTHTIKAVQMQGAGTSRKLVACASFPREIPEIAFEVDEFRLIAEILRRQGLTGSNIVIAVPHDHLKTGKLELPPLAPGVPVEQIAAVEFTRVHKCDVTTMELAVWDLPAPSRVSKTNHLIAVGYAHTDADAHLNNLEAGGFTVMAVDTFASALARASLPFLSEAKSIALLDLGWTGATLAMVRRGVLIYERRRKDIALKGLYAGLASTVDGSHEAVRYFLEEFGCKQQTGGPQVDHTRQAVLQYLDPLNQEIRRAAEYVQSQYPDSPVELLLVSGGGAHIAAATERLQATLGIEARAAAPERAVECVPALPRLSPGMAAALGLALFPVATR